MHFQNAIEAAINFFVKGLFHKRFNDRTKFTMDIAGSFTLVNETLKLNCSGHEFDYYKPVVKQRQDYYPFGMQMAGRSFTSGDGYRYGFQGMQRTDALAGSGNHYTAPNWEYSPRLGRRWNTDPVVYPWQSSYATFNNNPIYFKDPSGLQGIAFNGGGGDKKKGGGSTTSPQQPQIPKVDIKTVEVWADGPKKAGFFSRLWSGIKNFFTNAWNAFKKMDANIQGNGDPSGKGTHTLTGGTEINNSGVKGKEGNYINMEAWLIIGPRVGKAQPWRNTSVDNAVNAVGSASEAVQEYGAALGNSTDDDVKETSQENANNYHKKFKKVVSPDVVLYKTTNTNTGKKYYRKEEDGGSTHTIIDESTYNNYDLTEEEIK